MMKRKTLYSFLIFIAFFLSLQDVKSQCTDMNSDYLKTLLGEATYDNFRRTTIEYAKDPCDVEFQVDLLKNYTYKLVFDMSEKPEGVVVKLFDLGTKNEDKEPQLLYTSSEDIMDENKTFNISFEAPRTRMLVKYEVKDATYKGCVTFVLGIFKHQNTTVNVDQTN